MSENTKFVIVLFGSFGIASAVMLYGKAWINRAPMGVAFLLSLLVGVSTVAMLKTFGFVTSVVALAILSVLGFLAEAVFIKEQN